jgi:lipopolysaccharide transport system permease protein
VYGLNPMTGVVEGFRWVLVGSRAPGLIILASALVIAVLLAVALFYFRSAEGTFADSI